VKAEAAKEGFAARTVERSAKRLKVKIESRDFPRTTYWSIPVPVDRTEPTTRATVTTVNKYGVTGVTWRNCDLAAPIIISYALNLSPVTPAPPYKSTRAGLDATDWQIR
jgi:hypothetical protein